MTPAVTGGGRRILVVEDEMLLAMMLEDYLVSAGWRIVGPCSDLRTALAAAEREDFDVALLDVNLNGEMVYPLAEILLERQLPFALLTGYSETNLPPRLRTVPRLAKPCEERVLLRVLERLVAGPPPDDQAPRQGGR